MDVISVAEAMFDIVDGTDFYGVPECCSKKHLNEMLTKIVLQKVTGEKAHRWIGYIQGAIAMQEGATLEELKNLNR